METGINPRYAKMSKDMNIVRTKNRFVVQKAINYKNKQYGMYKTIEEARAVRDALNNSNWEESDEYIRVKFNTPTFQDRYVHHTKNGYEVVKTIDGKNKKFGVFDTIEEAREHRTECIINNWNIKE